MKSLRQVGEIVGHSGAPLTSLRDIARSIDPGLAGPISANETLTRGSVAQYTFTLDQFRITNTRARHEDTDYVAVALKVGDANIITQTQKIGNVNNGTHAVGISLGPVPIDGPGTPIVFNFEIVNDGHSSTEAAIGGLAETAKTFIEKYPTETNIWGLVAQGVLTVVGWVFADCDGPVAADQISLTEATLRAWTDASGSYAAPEKYYPGIDSPVGCGSNSEYYASWSVKRGF